MMDPDELTASPTKSKDFLLRAPGNRGSLEPFGRWAGVPAVAVAGSLDELTDDDQRGGEVEAEVHDLGVALGAAAQLAIAIHPRVCPLDHPPGTGLARGGGTPAR